MKITDVRTASIKGNFEWILVRVYSDEGLVGLGECYWGAGVEAIVNRMGRMTGRRGSLLVGEDPQNVDWLYQKMIRGMSGAGSTAGAVVSAISGIELALWDLKGKALGTPIYNLLGGRYRTRIRIYADCGHGAQPTPEAWAERAQQALARGYTALKFDINNISTGRSEALQHDRSLGFLGGPQCSISNEEMDLMVRLAGAVREAIGPHVDLALDCHWNYTPRDAIKLANELAPLRLLWLEDPVPPDNAEALKRVADNSPVPICSGENHYTRHGLRPLITTQAVDILHVDIPKSGGLLEAKKIADLADLYYIPFASHNVSTPVGTMAACHTCASMRNFLVMEFHSQDIPWWSDLVTGGAPVIKDGYVELPDRPGLGLELNDEVARAHLGEGATFFE